MNSAGINFLKKIAVLLNFYDNRLMNENTDSRKLEIELLYILEVRIPDQSPKKMEVMDRVLAGIDPRNDLILIDPKIKA
ncbi:MAG: hypothetical protein PHY93_03020 [Bacteriovorax sp.]|nr:hypothetical protein [Bacteriovorax sp.]